MCFPYLIYTVRPCLIHLPCRSSKATAQHGCQETACGPPGRIWLLPATTQSSTNIVIRFIPISDAGGQCETKHRLSWTRKRVVAAHYKKDDLLHCWTVRIFPAAMWTFHEGQGTVRIGQGCGVACVN